MDPEDLVVPCGCIQVYHVARLNTCTSHHSGPWGPCMFEIDFETGQTFCKLNLKILKLYLKFQIYSNGFLRDRSFGHESLINIHHPFFLTYFMDGPFPKNGKRLSRGDLRYDRRRDAFCK